MENAELYSIYNSMQKQDTQIMLEEFGPQLTWYEEEKVLDIGCGPGDVTNDVLLPILPSSTTLVGVDLSSKMVEYANKKYSSGRIHFETLDFSTKNITEFFQEEYFTKIFSFYCLHWIQDQQQAVKNLFTLLRPGGEFLVLLAPTNNVFMVYRLLSQMEKWKTYMEDVEDFIPCFYDSTDPCEEIRQVFTSQGLKVVICEEHNKTVSFSSMETLMRSNEAVNPFVKRMDQVTRDQYMACFEQVVLENQLCTETLSGEVMTDNSFIVVYGKRPHNISVYNNSSLQLNY